MTVYWQGSELEAIWPNPAGGTYVENGGVQGAWVRGAAAITGGTGWLRGGDGVARANLWMHFYTGPANTTNNQNNDTQVYIHDQDGNPVVRWNVTGGLTAANAVIEYLNTDGVWTQCTETFEWVSGTGSPFNSWDVHVQVGAEDKLEIYREEVALCELSGNLFHASITGFKHLYTTRNGRGRAMSEMIFANEPVLDWRLTTFVPTTDGTDSTDGEGSIADVSEQQINNDTFISFTSAGEKRSFKSPARTMTNKIKAFTVAARIRLEDLEIPNKIRPYVVPAGQTTRYYGDVIELSVGYENYQYTWNLNPYTGVAWTPTEINHADLEYGWEVVGG